MNKGKYAHVAEEPEPLKHGFGIFARLGCRVLIPGQFIYSIILL